MIKAVLFDMDGILFDSEKYYMQGTIKQMRLWGYKGPKKEIYRLIGTSIGETIDMLYSLLNGKKSRSEIERDNLRYFLVKKPIKPSAIIFPDVKNSLKRLKKLGIKMAVCSSSPWQTVILSLRDMGIRKYFDYIESGENLAHFKPAPDIYLAALEALGVRKDEAIVYEDSKIGIEAGKRAGILTFAREDKRYYQDQSEADYMVKNMKMLVDWLEEQINGNGN